MKEESRVCLNTYLLRYLINILSDGDTLFFFNYRSDRMREIVTVFGFDEKPVEVETPKDIVSNLCSCHVASDINNDDRA